MAAKRTILIAEDNEINRQILKKILQDDYDVVMAEDGEQTLKKLTPNITALILDLKMPVLDGFGVLRAMQEKGEYSNIPVLIATGNNDDENEIKALELGAWDFVSKPYNPKILKFRLHNAIEKSMLNFVQKLKFQAEHIELTGLYNENKFFEESRAMINRAPDKKYALFCFDTDRFKQLNILFGTKTGDNYLIYISNLLRKKGEKYENYIYANIAADLFAVCTEYHDREVFLDELTNVQKLVSDFEVQMELLVPFGIYFIEDTEIPVNVMFNRAKTAQQTVKGKFIDNVAIFTEEMSQKINQEHNIINEVRTALESRQFCVYYQPKYNMTNDLMIGAEALVRWKHPIKGLISPGVFIPILEKRGFIAKLDYYVWECVCSDLHNWIAAGFSPCPISVNVSRINLNNPNIVATINALVKKYDIPPHLLELEITESAYMDNPGVMKKMVNDFHKNGFTVLMDDFGSGYSSLNTLKEIPVDVLKLDMKFLPTGKRNIRSEKILASIIRMADWLNMTAIVEGVENVEQKDFLLSVGCQFAQGFYYAHPLPEKDFEILIKRNINPESTYDPTSFSPELDDLLASDSTTEVLLRGISVPVAIFEYSGNRNEMIRANQSFYDVFGYRTGDSKLKLDYVEGEEEKFKNLVLNVISTKSSSNCDVLFTSSYGTLHWYRIFIRYLMPDKNGHVVCAVFTDISQEKRVFSEINHMNGIIKQSSGTKQSMLIVDDSDMSCDMLSNVFNQEYNILRACNGKEAVQLMLKHSNDIAVILLDMIMPKMGGMDFLKIKKGLPEASSIPVIVISSDKSKDLQINMVRSGVNDYITKPFIPEIVYRRVHNVIEYQERFNEIVNEFNKIVNFPNKKSNGSKLSLSITETRILITYLKSLFDIVRLVDPNETAVLSIDGNDELSKDTCKCYSVWKKNERCENCTSRLCVQNNCQMFKYDFVDNEVFYVISSPVEIVLADGRTTTAVLEIVNHVPEALLKSEYYGVTVREIIENTQQNVYKDPLTGAYNRRFFDEMLFLKKKGKTVSLSLFMFDIDNFKKINDSNGHVVGDMILQEASHKIIDSLNCNETLIRYGGNKFLITCEGNQKESPEEFIKKMSSIVSKISVNADSNKFVDAKFGFCKVDEFHASSEFLHEMILEADRDKFKNRRS